MKELTMECLQSVLHDHIKAAVHNYRQPPYKGQRDDLNSRLITALETSVRILKLQEARQMPEDLKKTIAEAKQKEKVTGDRWYVCLWHDGTLEITKRMPLLGEWWDADGIKHG